MKSLINQRVPVAPGISLATDVHLPQGKGPFPTILMRTPYHRDRHQLESMMHLVEQGYAFVAQDCRGKYDSDGVFEPLVYELEDGQKSIDWVANQPWCNGRIGLWGRSYPGIVQVPAASGGHEALRCIAPSVEPTSFFRDWIRHDGCFALANIVHWMTIHSTCRTQPVTRHVDWDRLFALRSLDEIFERIGTSVPALRKVAEHDRQDAYWESVDQTPLQSLVKVPGYHAGGWFDHLTRGTLSSYKNIRDHGATSSARSGQRLLIGPWSHPLKGRTLGEWDFTAEATLPVLTHELQFFDFHLKEIDNGYSTQPPVKLFLMGENRWIHASEWPPPEAEVQHWYLDSKGSANSQAGDGVLALEEPQTTGADTFRYDPSDPVPTLGGPIFWWFESKGPIDQRPIANRLDVLCYRSEKLSKPLAVVGELGVSLRIASTAEDTDFVVKLCVEEPEGDLMVLALGSLRCRFRSSWSEPEPLSPGDAVSIEIDMGATAYVFPPESRIVLLVTSSDFPRILPHPNTLGAPFEAWRPQVARQSVLHGPGVGSHLRLPVIEL